MHIGAHRCGTATFQQFVRRNGDHLAARGVAIWGPQETRGGFFAGLMHPTAQVSAQMTRRGERSLGATMIELVRLERSGHGDLLISEPNMIGSVVENVHAAILYPDLRARLHRFAAGLQGRVRRIGLSLRAYDGFWASALAARIGQGRGMPEPQELAALTGQSRRWRDVIEEIAAVFPDADLIVWPFERFVSQPEVPLRHMVPTMAGARGLVGLRDWHNAGPGPAGLRRILAMRGDTRAADGLAEAPDRWMPFDGDQQAKLRHDYATDLAWLRSGAGGMARLVETARAPPETVPVACPGQFRATGAADTSKVDDMTAPAQPPRGWSQPPGFEIVVATAGRTDRKPPIEADAHERDDMV